MISHPTLTIVVPCYNESEVFKASSLALTNVLSILISKGKISNNSNVLFVDDGSRDDTWNKIITESLNITNVKGIKVSRNVGHQAALLAGLTHSKASDITISIDADLQDDVSIIEVMVDRFHAGADIVYGARNNRESDTLFKRLTATCYYKFLTKMGVEQVENHADFRLLSKRALNALLSFKERNIYIRGLVPLVGYSSDIVYYSRKERLAGESKYPLKKMLSLAWEGITSLSIKPLRLVSLLGICMSCLSLFGILYSLVVFLFGGTVQGWASVILAILLIGGIQLLATGVIGEYIGKIYIEVKDRPRFFISEDTDSKGNQ